jgi:transcription initiation factor TFIIA large subunit
LDENSEEMEDSGEGSPLNSDDDLSDEEDVDTIFKSENVSSSLTYFKIFNNFQVVVCQFEKVIRVKNKWKFQLLHGVKICKQMSF